MLALLQPESSTVTWSTRNHDVIARVPSAGMAWDREAIYLPIARAGTKRRCAVVTGHPDSALTVEPESVFVDQVRPSPPSRFCAASAVDCSMIFTAAH